MTWSGVTEDITGAEEQTEEWTEESGKASSQVRHKLSLKEQANQR